MRITTPCRKEYEPGLVHEKKTQETYVPTKIYRRRDSPSEDDEETRNVQYNIKSPLENGVDTRGNNRGTPKVLDVGSVWLGCPYPESMSSLPVFKSDETRESTHPTLEGLDVPLPPPCHHSFLRC